MFVCGVECSHLAENEAKTDGADVSTSTDDAGDGAGVRGVDEGNDGVRSSLGGLDEATEEDENRNSGPDSVVGVEGLEYDNEGCLTGETSEEHHDAALHRKLNEKFV